MAGQLGRRPHDPNRPILQMGAHLKATVTTPPSIDYTAHVGEWILGSNDRFGTCGPTSVANFALLVSTVLGDAPVRFTDEEIFDLYRRSGNPNFDPKTGADDNGVIMADLLSELVKNGIGFGDRNVKALAYGAVHASNPAETWAAASLFGGVLWGATLDEAQSTQFDGGKPWDVVKRSPVWGGHAILGGSRYNDVTGTTKDRTALVTWATLIDSTDAFIQQQVDEAYVVIFPWHLQSEGFREGIDLEAVAAEFKRLTGRTFPPIPAPPAPAPTPEPTPTPAADPFPYAAFELAQEALAQVGAWVARHPK